MVFKNLFESYLNYDHGQDLCIAYLQTKVNFLLSALRAADDLEFNSKWNKFITTTDEALVLYKRVEVETNKTLFYRAANNFLKDYRKQKQTISESNDIAIRKDEVLFIETIQKLIKQQKK